MGLISNLRKRRIFQILAAYLAAGFVVLQGMDQLVQHALVPAFAYPLTLWWYGVGAIAALVIGWFHGEKGAQKAPTAEIIVLGVLGVFLLGMTGARVHTHISDRAALAAAAQSDLDLRRIAVRYFDDLSSAGDYEHIADGLTEGLIAELATVRQLDVVSRNGVLPFRDAAVRVDSVARALRAGTVVTGSVEPVRDLIRINVRLHDGESGTEFRRVTLERPAEELFAAQADLVEGTARFLREWLGEEITVRRRQEDTESLQAWTLLQRAERERKEAERLIREEHDVDGAFEAFSRADELLGRAEVVDPQWIEPVVTRAQIGFRRSYFSFPPPDEAAPSLFEGLAHAERAVALAPNHPRAREVRGRLLYWWHLLPLLHDHEERQNVLRRAREDLERAVRLDPTLASAHADLAHLYARIDDRSAAVLAARRAYEEDAFLDNADDVLWRLISNLYEQESFPEARRWCDEGGRRFPHHFRFVECRLMLMTVGAWEPDPDEAWRLLARVDSLLPESVRTLQFAVNLTYVGGVLARTNLPDSADRVLRRAREMSRPGEDPHRDIYLHEAGMRATALGDVGGAIDLLKDFAVANPGYDFGHSWWWRSVRAHPRYEELLAFQRTDH